MSSGLAHQRVLRTVRLLPQAVKIGILESEIKQSGVKPPEQKQSARKEACSSSACSESSGEDARAGHERD